MFLDGSSCIVLDGRAHNPSRHASDLFHTGIQLSQMIRFPTVPVAKQIFNSSYRCSSRCQSNSPASASREPRCSRSIWRGTPQGKKGKIRLQAYRLLAPLGLHLIAMFVPADLGSAPDMGTSALTTNRHHAPHEEIISNLAGKRGRFSPPARSTSSQTRTEPDIGGHSSTLQLS